LIHFEVFCLLFLSFSCLAWPLKRFLQPFPDLRQLPHLQPFFGFDVAFSKLPCLPFSQLEHLEFPRHSASQAQLLLGAFLARLPLPLRVLTHWFKRISKQDSFFPTFFIDLLLPQSVQQVTIQQLLLPECAPILSTTRVLLL
jgi:hypothetical protein